MASRGSAPLHQGWLQAPSDAGLSIRRKAGAGGPSGTRAWAPQGCAPWQGARVSDATSSCEGARGSPCLHLCLSRLLGPGRPWQPVTTSLRHELIVLLRQFVKWKLIRGFPAWVPGTICHCLFTLFGHARFLFLSSGRRITKPHDATSLRGFDVSSLAAACPGVSPSTAGPRGCGTAWTPASGAGGSGCRQTQLRGHSLAA